MTFNSELKQPHIIMGSAENKRKSKIVQQMPELSCKIAKYCMTWMVFAGMVCNHAIVNG